MSKISMNRLCERLVAAGFPAHVEQTGGGIATIYAGAPFKPKPKITDAMIEAAWRSDKRMMRLGYENSRAAIEAALSADDTYEPADRYPMLVGPGWFDDQEKGWIDLEDSCYGPDDDGESAATYFEDHDTEDTVLEKLLAFLRNHNKENASMMSDEILILISADGKHRGVATETDDFCGLEDCGGTQYRVKWDDGDETTICAKGLRWLDDGRAQIVTCEE